MSVNNQRRNVAYGLSDALLNVSPLPIISKRAPLATDFAPLGQIWVDTVLNTSYILTSIVSAAASWLQIAGAGGVFTTLTVTGNITSTTGNIAATAGSVSAGTTMSAGTTITAGTGITATTGNIVASTW